MNIQIKHDNICLKLVKELSNDGFVFDLQFFEHIDLAVLGTENAVEVKNKLQKAGTSIIRANKVIVSLGTQEEFKPSILDDVAKAVYLKAKELLLAKIELAASFQDILFFSKCHKPTKESLLERFLFELLGDFYYFDELKTKKNVTLVKHIHLKLDLEQADVIFDNVNKLLDAEFLAKDLANYPANIATPTYLGNVAEEFASIPNVSVEIFDKKAIEELKMGGLLAVSQGSIEEPRFIALHYHGAEDKNEAPVVLVGKGVTFDSGGISIKAGTKMDEMKFDMCGAACTIGTFKAVASLGLKVNLVTLVVACENMPSGNALKPGDVITAMSGTTIEVLNTDAEGRLILCDALHYAKHLNPKFVIDLATLTGAMSANFGSVMSGVYSNDDALFAEIQGSAKRTNEKVWPMPLMEEYGREIIGQYADLKNIGNWARVAGSHIAAWFLYQFVDYKWAHFDIAGIAWDSNGGSNARPYKLLVDLIKNQASK